MKIAKETTVQLAKEKGYGKHPLPMFDINGKEIEVPNHCVFLYDILDWLRDDLGINVCVRQTNLPLTEPQTDIWEWGFTVEKVNKPMEDPITYGIGVGNYYEALKCGIVKTLKKL